MKNRICIYSLIALLLLSGCGKDSHVERQCGTRAITFDAVHSSVSVETKADKPVNIGELIAVGKTVSVFGVRVEGLTQEDVFVNQTLRCDEVPDPLTPSVTYSSVWSYTPLKYWKNSGIYYFSAVYPYIADASIDNEYFLNVTYRAGDNADLMVARGYRDVTGVDGTNPVPLVFRHATSAVRFLFGKASSSASDDYKITDFRLEGVAPNGTLKVLAKSEVNPAIIQSNWRPGAASTLFNWSANTPGDRITVVHPDDNDSGTTNDEDNPDLYTTLTHAKAGWFYMVPQTLTAASAVRFSVSYNGQTPVTTVLSIENRDGEPGADVWGPNRVYNYFITLNQSGIDLTVTCTPWDEVQVTTEDFLFEG